MSPFGTINLILAPVQQQLNYSHNPTEYFMADIWTNATDFNITKIYPSASPTNDQNILKTVMDILPSLFNHDPNFEMSLATIFLEPITLEECRKKIDDTMIYGDIQLRAAAN